MTRMEESDCGVLCNLTNTHTERERKKERERERDGDGDANEDEYGNTHEGRDGGELGSGNGDDNRDEGGGEREPGNLRNGNRGRLEGVRGGATPTSN